MIEKRNAISSSLKLQIIARVKFGQSLNSLEKEIGCQIRRWILQENCLTKLKKGQKRIECDGH